LSKLPPFLHQVVTKNGKNSTHYKTSQREVCFADNTRALAEPKVSLAKMAAINEAAAEMDKLARRISLMPYVFPWKSKRYSRKPTSFHG